MNRETRKANLRKLKLPSNSNDDLRKSARGTIKPTTTTTISNYFAAAKDDNFQGSLVLNTTNKSPSYETANTNGKLTSPPQSDDPAPIIEATTFKCPKRTKLTRFVLKDPQNISSPLRTNQRKIGFDDFETPQKKIKKAPQTKKKVRTKQPNIRSAFLRNEQIFSQITAQHCIADNFSPEDIQLALTISKSEVETRGEDDEVVVDLVDSGELGATKYGKVTESIRNKLQKYGFHTAAREDYNTITAALHMTKRGHKSNWATKFTPLTLRKPGIQTKKTNEKIEAFLAKQYPIRPLNDAKCLLSPYLLISSTLKKVKASPDMKIVANAEIMASHLEKFFVCDLFEVTYLKAAHLLKDWKAIQGRDLSPKRKSNKSQSRDEKLEEVYTELEQHFGMDNKIVFEFADNIESEKTETTNSINIDQSYNQEHEDIKLSNSASGNCEDVDKLLQLIEGISEDEFNLNVLKLSNQNSARLTLLKEPPEKKLKFVESNRCTCPAEIQPDTLEPIVSAGTSSTQNSRKTLSADEIFEGDLNLEIRKISNENERISSNLTDIIRTSDLEVPAEKKLKWLEIKKNDISSTQNTRSTSPDLFADSDTEMNDEESEESVCHTGIEEQCKALEYEIYSKDEEPLSSSPNEIVIDLTQELSPESPKSSLQKEPTSLAVPPNFIDYNSNSQQSRYDGNKANSKFSLDSNMGGLDDWYSPFKGSEVSVDLTQDAYDQDDDNECLVLSDDEINYSIWKADKSLVAAKMIPPHMKTQDLTFSSDLEQDLNEHEVDRSFSKLVNSYSHDFSLLDLIDDNKASHRTKQMETMTKTASTLSFDGDVEPIFTQFLTTPNKLQDNSTPTTSHLVRERAEFGILESYSNSLTQSPFKTPTKLKSQLWNHDHNDSFLQSLSKSETKHMKRFSSSSQKFNALLKSVGQQDSDDSDEFDYFDKLVYGSPPSQKIARPNEPAGLQQLLTGELSFCEDKVDYQTQRKLNASPLKRKSTTHLQSSEDLLEDVAINGKTYSVRVSTTPKPDFSKQTEAELFKKLYSFGIKPLKQKQAVKMLEYIYNQTHPIIVMEDEADCEVVRQNDNEKPSPSVALLKWSCKGTSQSKINEKESENSLNLSDCAGAQLLRFSHELCAESLEEFYIFQTNVSRKISQPLLPLHVAWHNLVCSNADLHEMVLTYEPVNLQNVYLFFKSLGYRYNPKDLKSFFDRRCIIFRYDLAAAAGKQHEQNRHVRKTKRKSDKCKY